MTSLYWVFILPLETLMRVILDVLHRVSSSYGLSIIALSVVVNTAILPLQRIAERMQQQERDIQARLAPLRTLIRKQAPKGYRFALLRTHYRQHGYHPAFALRSSAGLLLQIPFFIAAYHFLSHFPALKGEAFSVLRDLGQPDRLLSLGALSINLLPLLMTALNLASAVLYGKRLDRGGKLQIYGIALLFLVLLYAQPAALLLYWSTSNLYSLLKQLIPHSARQAKPMTIASPRCYRAYLSLTRPWFQLLLAFLGCYAFLLYAIRYRVSRLNEFVAIWPVLIVAFCYAALGIIACLAYRKHLKKMFALAFIALLVLLAIFLLPAVHGKIHHLRRLLVLLLAGIAILGMYRPFITFLDSRAQRLVLRFQGHEGRLFALS